MDGLRLLAALAVVLYHYVALRGGWAQDPARVFPTLYDFGLYGWLGVEFFFLISGFVICMSTWGRTLGDFAVSRVSRLYPAYWIGVLLTTATLTVWPQFREAATLERVAVNLTMLQKGLEVPDVDDAYWTLFVEMRFYLLFALVVVTGVTYRKCVLFCGAWTVAAMITPKVGGRMLDTWAMPPYSPYFVAGIAFYLMYRFKPTALLWGIVVTSFLLAQNYVGMRMAINLGAKRAAETSDTPARIIVLLAFVLMAACALGWFDKLRWKWLTVAGSLTYPLYVIHMYIGITIIGRLQGRVDPLPLLLGVVALMLVVAWLIHRLVERPLGAWLRGAMKRGVEEIRRNSPAAVPSTYRWVKVESATGTDVDGPGPAAGPAGGPESSTAGAVPVRRRPITPQTGEPHPHEPHPHGDADTESSPGRADGHSADTAGTRGAEAHTGEASMEEVAPGIRPEA